MEKIDIMNSDYQYSKAMNSLKELSLNNKKLIEKFLDANSLGKTATKGATNKVAGIRARTKNLYLLKISVRFFKKDLDKLNVKDMENLVRALNEDSFLKQNGNKYSPQTKSNIKKVLVMFLRYHLKDKTKFEKLTDWIETRFKKKDISALTEEEVKRLMKGCNTMKQKVLVSVLFDSGARIEEFLNIRGEDFVKVEGDIPYYRVTIREEFSKTKGRTFGLFWKGTTELIDDWFELNKDKPLTEPFFDSTYNGVRSILRKIGLRVLKKSINPHLLRHTSATYYAGQGMDYFQLCKRYGWSIGSNVPQTYIDRSGINEKQTEEKVKGLRFKELEEELFKFKQQNKKQNEESVELKEDVENLKSQFYKLITIGKRNKLPKEKEKKVMELIMREGLGFRPQS